MAPEDSLGFQRKDRLDPGLERETHGVAQRGKGRERQRLRGGEKEKM